MGEHRLPEGGFSGTEETCLAHVAEVWTDVIPAPRVGTSGPGQAVSIPAVRRGVTERQPLTTALRRRGENMSYGELDATSACLATAPDTTGVQRGDVIPVRLPRSPGLVAALLAVLRLGAAYVAVPADWPTGRLEQLVGSVVHRWPRATSRTALGGPARPSV